MKTRAAFASPWILAVISILPGFDTCGGDPSGPGSDSSSLLPEVTVDVDHLNFIFRRTDAAAGYDPFTEYSSSLGPWIMAEPGVDGVFIEE